MTWALVFATWTLLAAVIVLGLHLLTPSAKRSSPRKLFAQLQRLRDERKAWADLERAIMRDDFEAAYDAAMRTGDPALRVAAINARLNRLLSASGPRRN